MNERRSGKWRAMALVRLSFRALPLLAMVAPVHALTVFTVDTTADLVDENFDDGFCLTRVGNCSLRAAVTQSNRIQTTTRIELPAGTYPLTRLPTPADGSEDDGDLDVRKGSPLKLLFIVGAGATSTVIDANRIDRAFDVEAATAIQIRGVTIRNGRTADAGGGIRNSGILYINDSVIERSESGSKGGGISSTGNLDLLNTIVRANRSALDGGGISTVNGTGDIRNSTLHGNHARDSGGALFNSGQDRDPVPPFVLINTTVSTNSADLDGGGIENLGALGLYNTSVIDNDADHDRDEDGGTGGGVHNLARLVIRNSLIARNTVRDAPIDDDCVGVLEAYGRNFFGTVTGCNVPNPGSGIVALESIGALQDNGGPTPTHALLPGSAAIGNAVACVDAYGTPLTTDQRGAPRISGLSCDVGSVEYNSIVPRPDLILGDGFE